MAIYIDFPEVGNIASRISDENNRLREEFDRVNYAMNTLNKHWDGTASQNAFRAFRNLADSYCENRYNVIDDLVRFLGTQVTADYRATESTVKNSANAFRSASKAADAFK